VAPDDAKTSKRYDVSMSAPKRSTIYFDPDLHRALRLKAAATDRSISEVVNDAVRQTLSEDASDLEAFEKRRREPSLDFAEVVLKMRRSGKL
jgi:plasmid stability protein